MTLISARSDGKSFGFRNAGNASIIFAGLALFSTLLAEPMQAHAQDRPDGRAEALTLPISNPLPLLGLIKRLSPDAMPKFVKSCFTSNRCMRQEQYLRHYESLNILVPSTRIAAALINCSKLEAVKNEFEMNDLDVETAKAIEAAAASVSTTLRNVTARAEVGPYDFSRGGFPIKWVKPIPIHNGRSVCRGDRVIDALFWYPRDFYVDIDPSQLPPFRPVPSEKAKMWVEKGKIIYLKITFTTSVATAVAQRINRYGEDAGAWIFKGSSTPVGMTWMSGDSEVLEEVAIAPATPPAALPTTAAVPKADAIKTGTIRIVKADVNVRATPSRAADLAVVLKANQYVAVVAKSPDGLWSRISVDKREVGWILDTAFLKNSMTEEEAAAISEGNSYDNVEPPKN